VKPVKFVTTPALVVASLGLSQPLKGRTVSPIMPRFIDCARDLARSFSS